MKNELMEILACPLCRGDLELEVVEKEGGEITKGTLICAACRQTYPIIGGIPNLLPPDLKTQP